MQTDLTAGPLRVPDAESSNAALPTRVDSCMRTATSPTLLLFGADRDSPRGRICLIKDMPETGPSAAAEPERHVRRRLAWNPIEPLDWTAAGPRLLGIAS